MRKHPFRDAVVWVTWGRSGRWARLLNRLVGVRRSEHFDHVTWSGPHGMPEGHDSASPGPGWPGPAWPPGGSPQPGEGP